MLSKYYSYNFVDGHGVKVGSYVIEVWFWQTPLKAIDLAKNLKPSNNVYITDFKRIK